MTTAYIREWVATAPQTVYHAHTMFQTTAAPARDKVLELMAKGLTTREIATVMGVTTQRVAAIKRRARELGLLDDREAQAS